MAGNKRALCVGINVFQNYPSATLQGCVSDAHDMAGVLTDVLGFGAADITVLTDAKATKKNIMDSLKSMVAEAQAGRFNYLVFSLSTHGTLVPDISGDEPDRTDDAFCPHDLADIGNVWDPAHLISADELVDIFAMLPRNVSLELFLDTCHSGTGLRAPDLHPVRKPRFLPPPSLEALWNAEGRRSRGLTRGILERGQVNRPIWLGCRADQTSSDALIGGEWHGAFTYYFCKEMRACKNKLSRLEVLRKVIADLRAGRFLQIPQLEGDSTLRKSPIT